MKKSIYSIDTRTVQDRLKDQCVPDQKGRYRTKDVIKVAEQINKERLEALELLRAYKEHASNISKSSKL